MPLMPLPSWDDIAHLASEMQQQFAAGDEASLDLAADSRTKMQFYRKLQHEAMEMDLALEDETAS